MKNFKKNSLELKLLVFGYGSCMATDQITVQGKPVGYMYRDEPGDELDSGWVFMSGDETQEYMDNPDNIEVYDVNTIANYDPDIIEFLDSPIGSSFERNELGVFVEIR